MIALSDEEFMALWEMAQRERRDFRDQAALLLCQMMKEIATKDDKSESNKERPDTVTLGGGAASGALPPITKRNGGAP